MDEQLIELVSRHEVIYDVKSEAYRDTGLRNAAWDEIARQHGKSVEECKESWNKLRNCYNNAIKRRRKKTRIGKKIPPWRFESQMSFLLPHLQQYTDPPNEDDPLEVPSPQSVKSPTPSCSSIPVKRKTASICDYMSHSQHANILDTSERLDDSDHFFLTMSRMAKKLPRIDQIRIQMELHKAIYEVELGLLKEESTNLDKNYKINK